MVMRDRDEDGDDGEGRGALVLALLSERRLLWLTISTSMSSSRMAPGDTLLHTALVG